MRCNICRGTGTIELFPETPIENNFKVLDSYCIVVEKYPCPKCQNVARFTRLRARIEFLGEELELLQKLKVHDGDDYTQWLSDRKKHKLYELVQYMLENNFVKYEEVIDGIFELEIRAISLDEYIDVDF